MNFQLDYLKDKVEFFEASSIKDLETKIAEQIDHNKAIMMEVHSVTHQMHVLEDGRRFYSAVVHFKTNM